MNFFKRLILPKQEFVIFLGEEYTEVYINNGNNNHVQLVQPGKTQWHHEVFTPLNPNNAREDSTGKLAEEKQNVKTAVLDALIQIGNANMSEEDMGTDQTGIALMGNVYTATEIILKILQQIKQQCESGFSYLVRKAIVIAPSSVCRDQNEAFKQICLSAGIKALAVVNQHFVISYQHFLLNSRLRLCTCLVLNSSSRDVNISLITIDNHQNAVQTTVKNLTLNNIIHKCGDPLIEYYLKELKSKYLLDFDKLERSDESSRWSIMKKTEVKLKCYEASRSFLMPNAPSSVVLKLFNQNETLPDFIFTHEISTLKEKNGLEIKIPRNLFDSLNKKLYKNCIKEVQPFLEAGNTKLDRITDFTLVNFGLENRLTMQISKLLKKDIQIIKLDLVPGNTDIIRTALSIYDLQERNILKMNENSDEVMIPSVDSDSMTTETTLPREEVLRLATKIYLGLMEIKIPQSKSVRLSTKHKYHKQCVESTLATLQNGMLAPIHEDVLAKIQWRLNESYFQKYVLDQEEIQHLKVKELIDNCPSHSTSSLSDEDSMHKNCRTHRASFNDEPKSLLLKVSTRNSSVRFKICSSVQFEQ
ncbi:unnamed protein product [Allacma fusca]|uniref:Uncharacterized protein n=1 Tax=Allacma fusca TaxID=39272 RepID=A0A8J2IZW1_9HEXA|nr:unnamed protein product [Allacma fusca]